jgi:hypothetical protein
VEVGEGRLVPEIFRRLPSSKNGLGTDGVYLIKSGLSEIIMPDYTSTKDVDFVDFLHLQKSGKRGEGKAATSRLKNGRIVNEGIGVSLDSHVSSKIGSSRNGIIAGSVEANLNVRTSKLNVITYSDRVFSAFFTVPPVPRSNTHSDLTEFLSGHTTKSQKRAVMIEADPLVSRIQYCGDVAIRRGANT